MSTATVRRFSSLGAVVLGYGDEQRATVRQLDLGVLCCRTPLRSRSPRNWWNSSCADMVPAKNGTDATSAAIRLAGAATGRTT